MNDRNNHGATRDDVYEYALQQYGTTPEHPWASLPLYAVLRRPDNKKWYAIVMNLPKSKLGLQGDDRVDILDIKCDPMLREILLSMPAYLPAYHLDRNNWITVLLDGSADKSELFSLIDESYAIASGKKSQKRKRLAPKSILVPVNPKFFDIQKAFDESDTILWKQTGTVIAGDTVYLYIAAPLSCICYRCEAIETDIPYEYNDTNIHMKTVMKIRLLHKYAQDEFGIDVLRSHGVVSVRGPRSIPNTLLRKLERSSSSAND